MKSKWWLIGMAMFLVLMLARVHAQAPGGDGIGWNDDNFDDLVKDIAFFLIASPLAGAVLGMGRLLTEANSRAKLMPIKLD
jgi:hypothetical protein